MSDERIITAAIVATGEKSDGKHLKNLVQKSKEAGMTIDRIIGDTAYSEKDNIQYAKIEEFQLVSKLNPQITQGGRAKEDEFEFNKNAGMYVCKAGHMAKARIGKKGQSKIKRIHITLILKNAINVLSVRVVINKGEKVRHILFQ